MTTNWKIEQMERELSDGGVITAHYRVFATEQDETVSAYGSQQLVPDPASPDLDRKSTRLNSSHSSVSRMPSSA